MTWVQKNVKINNREGGGTIIWDSRVNCLNKRDRFAEGFNTREVLFILGASTSLFLIVVGL